MRDSALKSADAERILNDPTYAEGWQAVESQIVRAIKDAPLECDADRERIIELVRRLKSVDASKRWLDLAMQQGQIQAHELRKKSLLNRGGL